LELLSKDCEIVKKYQEVLFCLYKYGARILTVADIVSISNLAMFQGKKLLIGARQKRRQNFFPGKVQ